MGCRFCILGCFINGKYNCCYECEDLQICIRHNNACFGMPNQYKDCEYYIDTGSDFKRSVAIAKRLAFDCKEKDVTDTSHLIVQTLIDEIPSIVEKTDREAEIVIKEQNLIWENACEIVNRVYKLGLDKDMLIKKLNGSD